MINNDDAFLNQFNTSLSTENEQRFANWLAAEGQRRGRDLSKDLYNYDLRGYWLGGGYQDTTGKGHMPDTYKKPNHPTFSTESMYHDNDKYIGGTWSEKGDSFTPGKTNLQMHSTPGLQQYFRKVEPNVILNIPGIKK